MSYMDHPPDAGFSVTSEQASGKIIKDEDEALKEAHRLKIVTGMDVQIIKV